jgi:hypothetical protein
MLWRQASEPTATATVAPIACDTQMNDAGNSQVRIILAPSSAAVSNFDFPMTYDMFQSGTTASSSSSDAPPLQGPCALLESLTRSYDPDAEDVQTSCGEYLELIFIHREAFAARPSAHAGCSAAFSALARALELRAWRADRDADTEAVAAFRHEAWMVAAWMSSGGPWWRGGEKMED